MRMSKLDQPNIETLRPGADRGHHLECDDAFCRRERDRLSRQNRQLLEQRSRDFDQGMSCAAEMFAAGASVDDVRAKIRKPGGHALARGTKEFRERDTQPFQPLDPNDIK
jgi:hypothetical protein